MYLVNVDVSVFVRMCVYLGGEADTRPQAVAAPSITSSVPAWERIKSNASPIRLNIQMPCLTAPGRGVVLKEVELGL